MKKEVPKKEEAKKEELSVPDYLKGLNDAKGFNEFFNFDKVIKSIPVKEAIHLGMVTNIVLTHREYLEEVKHKGFWRSLHE